MGNSCRTKTNTQFVHAAVRSTTSAQGRLLPSGTQRTSEPSSWFGWSDRSDHCTLSSYISLRVSFSIRFLSSKHSIFIFGSAIPPHSDKAARRVVSLLKSPARLNRQSAGSRRIDRHGAARVPAEVHSFVGSPGALSGASGKENRGQRRRGALNQ